ncbi:nicotine N-demethylase CYP82E4-like [Nicotiana tomentosiformis]|uniref:nicotine N-demethylase CYP82E4-like n=1 Tax=Nicotiana tomentosiformis TaxID=4098 RepID=UPI00388C3A48
MYHLLSPIEAIVGLVTFAFLLYLLWTKKQSNILNPLPPKIPGGWPVIGHLFYFNNNGDDDRHFSQKLGDLADKYGPVFTFRLGFRRFLAVSSYEAMKECFSTNDIHFADRPALLYGEYLCYNNAMLAVAKYGPYWKKNRKLVNQELLSVSRLEKFKHVRFSIVQKNIKQLYNCDSPMVKINLSDWIDKLTFDIILKMVVGKTYNNGHGEILKAAFQKFMVQAMEIELYDVFHIPFFKWLDLTGNIKAMKQTFKDIDNIIQGWLDEHIKKRETKDVGGENEQDFIDVLLSKRSNEHLGDGYSHDTTIKATVFTLVLDATDTLALHIKWVMALMINNKNVMKKAQEEMDTIVGRDRWVEENDIKNLVYLQAIVKEVLRLHPPAPLSVQHLSVKDCVVNGYHIPKGTALLTNIMKLQRDPQIWVDPDTFDPERFLTTNAAIDYRGQHYELIPFGSGRRACPAMNYSLQVEHLSIAHLIQGFNFATTTNEPLDMKQGVGLTLPKKTDVEVLITPRLPPTLYQY